MYAPRDHHIVLSDVRQKQISYHLSNLKYTNRLIYKTNRFTDRNSKLMVTKEERMGGGVKKEFGISKYKLAVVSHSSSPHQAPLCMEFSRQEHWSG